MFSIVVFYVRDDAGLESTPGGIGRTMSPQDPVAGQGLFIRHVRFKAFERLWPPLEKRGSIFTLVFVLTVSVFFQILRSLQNLNLWCLCSQFTVLFFAAGKKPGQALVLLGKPTEDFRRMVCDSVKSMSMGVA